MRLVGEIFLLVLFLLVTTFKSQIGPYSSYLVQSGSMSPTIKVGDFILTKSTPNYQPNDIITFVTKDNRVVTHRIIKIDASKFVTKGDANQSSDLEPVSQNQIVGKHLATIPLLGFFVVFLKTLPGLVVFVIIPSLFFIYDRILDFQTNV
jgi:signal peptidase